MLIFKLGNLMENPLFKIAFLNDQNTLEISPLHLVGSGFLKA